MWELRWVLLGLGCLLIAGIYVWDRLRIRRRTAEAGTGTGGAAERRRTEPTITLPDADADAEVPAHPEPAIADDVSAPVQPVSAHPDTTSPERHPTSAAPKTTEVVESEPGVELAARESLSPDAPDRVIALRFVARDQELNCQQAILALREAGLKHGQYGIFHRIRDGQTEHPGFSVANLTEPGAFDLASAADSTLPGMTFFLILPGIGDPVVRFDDMLQTARTLARKLDAELFDDRGSSWSIQRERYIREEIILYRHQHGFGVVRE